MQLVTPTRGRVQEVAMKMGPHHHHFARPGILFTPTIGTCDLQSP